MLTIEQVREMTEAVSKLSWISASSYSYEAHRAKVERAIAALGAIKADVHVPDSIDSLVTACRTLEAVASYAAKTVRKELTDSAEQTYREAMVAAALEIRDWWRGEGSYAPPDAMPTEAPAPIAAEAT